MLIFAFFSYFSFFFGLGKGEGGGEVLFMKHQHFNTISWPVSANRIFFAWSWRNCVTSTFLLLEFVYIVEAGDADHMGVHCRSLIRGWKSVLRPLIWGILGRGLGSIPDFCHIPASFLQIVDIVFAERTISAFMFYVPVAQNMANILKKWPSQEVPWQKSTFTWELRPNFPQKNLYLKIVL